MNDGMDFELIIGKNITHRPYDEACYQLWIHLPSNPELDRIYAVDRTIEGLARKYFNQEGIKYNRRPLEVDINKTATSVTVKSADEYPSYEWFKGVPYEDINEFIIRVKLEQINKENESFQLW